MKNQEANPRDFRWSCGLEANDPNIENKKDWPGENLLGKVLMELRKDLK